MTADFGIVRVVAQTATVQGGRRRRALAEEEIDHGLRFHPFPPLVRCRHRRDGRPRHGGVADLGRLRRRGRCPGCCAPAVGCRGARDLGPRGRGAGAGLRHRRRLRDRRGRRPRCQRDHGRRGRRGHRLLVHALGRLGVRLQHAAAGGRRHRGQRRRLCERHAPRRRRRRRPRRHPRLGRDQRRDRRLAVGPGLRRGGAHLRRPHDRRFRRPLGRPRLHHQSHGQRPGLDGGPAGRHRGARRRAALLDQGHQALPSRERPRGGRPRGVHGRSHQRAEHQGHQGRHPRHGRPGRQPRGAPALHAGHAAGLRRGRQDSL